LRRHIPLLPGEQHGETRRVRKSKLTSRCWKSAPGDCYRRLYCSRVEQQHPRTRGPRRAPIPRASPGDLEDDVQKINHITTSPHMRYHINPIQTSYFTRCFILSPFCLFTEHAVINGVMLLPSAITGNPIRKNCFISVHVHRRLTITTMSPAWNVTNHTIIHKYRVRNSSHLIPLGLLRSVLRPTCQPVGNTTLHATRISTIHHSIRIERDLPDPSPPEPDDTSHRDNPAHDHRGP
jgi:hypothetical protein